MASRCFCGAFVGKPNPNSRVYVCASCGAATRIPATKARRSEVARMGAIARMQGQTAERRSEIARNAALARHARKAKEKDHA